MSTSKITAQKTNKLSDVVYEKILRAVIEGEYPKNTKLPAEAEFCTKYGVSRPVIREALNRLREDEVVVSRQGSGTFVKGTQSNSSMLMFAPINSISDIQRCFEFRIGLEGEVAYLAAQRYDDTESEQLDEAFKQLELAVDSNELGVDADFNFHLAIAVISKNKYYESTLRSLRDSIVSGINVARQLSLMRPKVRISAVQKEHRNIYYAIKNGDKELARQAMREHLSNAKLRIFEGV